MLGQCWAERICRGAVCYEPAWPVAGDKALRALEIARRMVRALAKDPRLLEELAQACNAGAVAWWQRRPPRYRPLEIVTAEDERERCMVATYGKRCEERTKWLIGDVGAQGYAYTCTAHLELVRRPGEMATEVDQTSGSVVGIDPVL